ncbi:hypothetical protein FHW96_001153 [Novosphingobium sp. SG751A]|uniref:DUF7146 domain-containing protein n=1 Tax=Novosphingobium sp. SG751A TaxID=2587000 RepID=UPI00155393BF|nr:toprim domain-containing protein [Novosphingobium sp. SG751A]NOW45007.1 hypothetical protein [Novosphingobium sp. SG751A]
MTGPASDLSRALARNAEAVCRHYLGAGRREGRYWIAGDALGSPGRSLYVRLKGDDHGKGAAGKWTDAATGEHGDLLDLIGLNCGHRALAETIEEARIFLSLPRELPDLDREEPRRPAGSRKAARRLFAASKPIAHTLAETYLRHRAITGMRSERRLRFHSRCRYRTNEGDALDTPNAFPALIAAVTDLDGTITGVHRTWLDSEGTNKASVATPRRAMGDLLGHGVRFGTSGPVMIAGEGIETILSLRMAVPRLAMIAGLSAPHLAATAFPPELQRLYVARDDDPAGTHAVATLAERTHAVGITMIVLEPQLDDFNADLRQMGLDRLRAHLARQFAPEDRARFLLSMG